MLIFTQFQITNCLRIDMSSVWTLRSRAADDIAFHRENLEKKIVAKMISKNLNFSWYNYYSTSSFLHAHDLLHLDNPGSGSGWMRNNIQSKSKKFLISRWIEL